MHTPNTTINLSEAATLLATIGKTNTLYLQGEPGIGKSALGALICERMDIPESQFRYVDCTRLDLGDVQMPIINDHASTKPCKNVDTISTNPLRTVSFAPNELFTSTDGLPLVIMLDELGKANRGVQNALLPLLYEHRNGAYVLPEGSIVFATSNMASDGVGDNLQVHAKNRTTFITVRKPNADEWVAWATEHGVDPVVTGWVTKYPQCLQSYMDVMGDPDAQNQNTGRVQSRRANQSQTQATDDMHNPYIYDPRRPPAGAFVTPRSLEKASHILRERHNLPQGALHAALVGTIGQAAALDMAAFISLADDIPDYADIIKDPDAHPVPDSAISASILVLGAVARVTKKDIDSWMAYLVRLPREVQFMFVQTALRTQTPRQVLISSKEFTRKWALENSVMI